MNWPHFPKQETREQINHSFLMKNILTRKTLLIISLLGCISFSSPCMAKENNKIGETLPELEKLWENGESSKDNDGYPMMTWKKDGYTIQAFFSHKKNTCFKIKIEKGWRENILTKKEALKFVATICEGVQFPKDKQNKEDLYQVKRGTLMVEYKNWYWPQAGAQQGLLTIVDTRLEKLAEGERRQFLAEQERAERSSK